jgi:hypothetical protein
MFYEPWQEYCIELNCPMQCVHFLIVNETVNHADFDATKAMEGIQPSQKPNWYESRQCHVALSSDMSTSDE